MSLTDDVDEFLEKFHLRIAILDVVGVELFVAVELLEEMCVTNHLLMSQTNFCLPFCSARIDCSDRAANENNKKSVGSIKHR